jgi:hypothetical protein
MCPSYVTIHDEAPIRVGILLNQIGVCHVLVTVHENVGMGIAPNERSVLFLTNATKGNTKKIQLCEYTAFVQGMEHEVKI